MTTANPRESMTPLQAAAFTFPDQNAIARRIGRFTVYICVKAAPDRKSGAWVATVERGDGAFVDRWSKDDKAQALQHLRRVVRGVGVEFRQKTARGPSYIGLERPLSGEELEVMQPPMPVELRHEDALRDDFPAWRKAMLWWAYLWLRMALKKREVQPPALPPATAATTDSETVELEP